jgi:competence protein ComEA
MSVCTKWLTSIGGRRRAVATAAVVLAGLAAGWFALHPATDAAPVPLAAQGDPAAPAAVLVFVSGAVSHPGLYELSAAARIADAIAAAGGLTALADPGRLPDLASRVHDGRQVNVPFARNGTSRAARLDLNSAAVDELAAVPGMPPGLAQAIVAFRDQWGPFTSVAQLRTELGVDSATASALGHYLRVVPAPG